MKEESYIHDEEKISDIIESHRKNVFDYAEQQMFMAFDEIWAILQEHGLWGISKKKINGINSATLKNIYMRLVCGDNLREVPEETVRLWLVEFLKIQTMSFEIQRAQYPNFLKPWTKETADCDSPRPTVGRGQLRSSSDLFYCSSGCGLFLGWVDHWDIHLPQ